MIEVADITVPIMLDDETLNSLPDQIRTFLKGYTDDFFELFEPFFEWLKLQGLPEQYQKEIKSFDPLKDNAWKKLAENQAVIMLIKSHKANIEDSSLSKKLKEFCLIIANSGYAFIEDKDKDKEWEYDPDSIQHVFTIIIDKDKLGLLASLAELFPEQTQIFPAKTA